MKKSNLKSASKAFKDLMTRYITGQIPEPRWQRITELLDSTNLTRDERMALAVAFDESYRS